ncbi:MAG: hydrogenase maturation protease [Candidatus Saliniplasma sp.]
MKKIGVIGIGNIYRGDDGIGPTLVRKLKEKPFPTNIPFFDIGLKEMNLLHILKDLDSVLIIDAVNFDGDVGEFKFFEMDEVDSIREISGSHGSNLFKIVELSKKMGEAPDEIIIMGIKPGSMELGDEMSDEILENIGIYLESIEERMKDMNSE